MKNKINWKNATITILAAGNLLFSLDGSHQQQKINKLESDVHNLKNELVTLDEEAGNWYSLYKEALNDLYFLEIEAGLYNERPDTVARDPMKGGGIK